MASEAVPAFFRLFIAIPVPPEVRQEIGRAQGRLRRAAPPGTVRWTPADQFHVTLKFLGDVPVAQVAALQQAVAEVCGRQPALSLSARGIGFFPGVHKPRVVWAGADDGGGRLAELHRQLDAALYWLAPAELKFTGHITLGRFKPGRPLAVAPLLKVAAGYHARHFGDWLAREVEIVQSELTSLRAEHTPIAGFPLKGPCGRPPGF